VSSVHLAGLTAWVTLTTSLRSPVRITALMLFGLIVPSCVSHRRVTVGVVFATAWTFHGARMAEPDRAVVIQSTFDTLREAFTGFEVLLVDSASADHVVRVEDAGSGQRVSLGAVGVTYPVARASSVKIDTLFDNELAVIGCSDARTCQKSRTELLDGLGRGVGATAAHELGHQVGFGFTRDSTCADCLDGNSSYDRAHFFGRKHWSDDARRRMQQVLPFGDVHVQLRRQT